jgi:hypothetical protein
MSLNLEIIQPNDFIRLNGKGEYDQPQSRKVLVEIAKACVKKGISCALLDVRDARSDMQLDDVYQLALAFKEMGFKKNHRLAILYRPNAPKRVKFFAVRPGERAQLFALCASDGGWNVRAFDDYGEAIEWFASAATMK